MKKRACHSVLALLPRYVCVRLGAAVVPLYRRTRDVVFPSPLLAVQASEPVQLTTGIAHFHRRSKLPTNALQKLEQIFVVFYEYDHYSRFKYDI